MFAILMLLLVLAMPAYGDVSFCSLQIGPGGTVPQTNPQRLRCVHDAKRLARLCRRICRHEGGTNLCGRACSARLDCDAALPTVAECCNAGLSVPPTLTCDGCNTCGKGTPIFSPSGAFL
jgi:hypothetical protein